MGKYNNIKSIFLILIPRDIHNTPECNYISQRTFDKMKLIRN